MGGCNMKMFAIALKELGMKDDLIIDIITRYNKQQLKDLFVHKDLSFFRSDLRLVQYSERFTSSELENALQRALEIIKKNKINGIQTIIYNDKSYPQNLKNIENPPPVIYFKGKRPNNTFSKSLACVGTREPSKFSINATNYLIPQWVNEEFIIVSGLAAGVDTLAHISCLESGGTTVAVLAHGLDSIYPKENEQLAQKIVDNGGTLISEYPAGTKPDKFRFVNRNRLIVGIALGTIVFEMKIKSGTMHSVDYTLEQGKPLFCPNPGNEINENLDGLRFIMKNKSAISIANGSSFEIPIFRLGYKLKHNPVHMMKIKETYVKSILSNTNIQVNYDEVLSKLSNNDNLKKKSIMVNNLQFEEFKKIADASHLTIKELLNTIIEQVVVNNKQL